MPDHSCLNNRNSVALAKDCLMKPVAHSPLLPEAIQRKLEAAGLRRTLMSRAALGCFLENPDQEFTHIQVMAALKGRGLSADRVTLYRLLDRLARAGVLTRRAHDESRVWKYRLVPGDDAELTARFECDSCHAQFDLAPAEGAQSASVQQFLQALATQGHRLTAIHGTCASCSASRS